MIYIIVLIINFVLILIIVLMVNKIIKIANKID